jgi:hypothetical protein
MKLSNSRSRGARTACLAALVMAIGVIGSIARADAPSPPLVNRNASDPFITTCYDYSAQQSGLCLYTSQDLGLKCPWPDCGFAMNGTRQWFTTGVADYNGNLVWLDKGLAFNEDQYPWVKKPPQISNPTNHQWAPAMAQGPAPGTPWRPMYYLYVPDVTDPTTKDGQNKSSEIGVSKSTNAFGPWTLMENQGVVEAIGSNGQRLIPSLNNKGYMSDPDVFPSQFFVQDVQRYMLWANGTGSNCGTLSIAKLNSDMRTLDATNKSKAEDFQISISNLNKLPGPCPGGVPYLEGPSLFDFTITAPELSQKFDNKLPGKYTLVFPAGMKSGGIPSECQSKWGETNTDKQVIAYATSDSDDPTGSYTYRGVLMCGSTTEYTNQATIFQATTAWGSPRLIMIYHDNGDNPANRKVHAECMTIVPDGDDPANTTKKKFAINDRTKEGYTWCLRSHHIVALRARHKGSYVGANDPEHGKGVQTSYGGNERTRIGPWEWFEMTVVGQDSSGNNMVRFRARSTDQFVSARNEKLYADIGAPYATEVFTVIDHGKGVVALKASNGKYVANEEQSGGNYGWLVANRTNEGDWEKFDLIDLYTD